MDQSGLGTSSPALPAAWSAGPAGINGGIDINAPQPAPAPAVIPAAPVAPQAPASSSGPTPTPQAPYTGPGLDPAIKALTLAIRQQESGGDYKATSKDGSYGGYQFIKGTWDATASKYGVNASWEKATPDEQNQVAYGQIADWKNAGYTPAQIASMWNAGHGEPNAYTGQFSNGHPSEGTNKFGVKYSVPAYVKAVTGYFTHYYDLGKNQSADSSTPTALASTTDQPQTPTLPTTIPSTADHSVFPAKEDDSLLGGLGKLIGNIPGSAYNFAKGAIGALNPLNTIKTLSQIPEEFQHLVQESGGVGNALGATAKELLPTAYHQLVPESTQEGVKALAGFGKNPGQIAPTLANLIPGVNVPTQYDPNIDQPLSNARRIIDNDPVGQIAPFLLAGEGAAKVADTHFGGLADAAEANRVGFDKTGINVMPKQGVYQQAYENAISKVGGPIADQIQKPFDFAKSIASGPNADNVDQFIVNKFNKAIRPTVAGKGSAADIANYENNIVGAVTDIIKNKEHLNIENADGEITGKSPETVEELAQAVSADKKHIWSNVEANNTKATGQGIMIDTSPVIKELETIANDKVTSSEHPEVAAYARRAANALKTKAADGTVTGAVQYTPTEMQQAVTSLNSELRGLKTYGEMGKAGIDGVRKNMYDKLLDQAMEDSTGESNKALRKTYAQLSSIEKDVVHRAVVHGRKAAKGMGETLIDAGSAAEFIRGLAKMSPVDVAVSGGMKGISAYYKYLNDPNVAIRKMFRGAEKAIGEGKTRPTSEQDIPPETTSKSQSSAYTGNVPPSGFGVNQASVDNANPIKGGNGVYEKGLVPTQPPAPQKFGRPDFYVSPNGIIMSDVNSPEIHPGIKTPTTTKKGLGAQKKAADFVRNTNESYAYEPYTPDSELPVIKAGLGKPKK